MIDVIMHFSSHLCLNYRMTVDSMNNYFCFKKWSPSWSPECHLDLVNWTSWNTFHYTGHAHPTTKLPGY